MTQQLNILHFWKDAREGHPQVEQDQESELKYFNFVLLYISIPFKVKTHKIFLQTKLKKGKEVFFCVFKLYVYSNRPNQRRRESSRRRRSNNHHHLTRKTRKKLRGGKLSWSWWWWRKMWRKTKTSISTWRRSSKIRKKRRKVSFI